MVEMQKPVTNGKPVKNYYFCTIDKNEVKTIYKSELYRLTEYDIIDLIKALLVNKRLVGVGRKILYMYQDSEDYSADSSRRLREIGLDIEQNRIEKMREKGIVK